MKLQCLVIFVALVSQVAQAKDVKLKEYVIDLDAEPGTRWHAVARENKDKIMQVFTGFVETIGKNPFEMMSILASSVTHELPKEYREELIGFADYVNITVGEMMVFNMLYEMTAFGDRSSKACTSIVATQPNGHIIHGRNLDYSVPGLNYLSIMLDFQKGGKTVYKGTSFAGYIGLMTGMRPNGFTISLDERNKGVWSSNDWESAMLGANGLIAFKIRDLLGDSSIDFEKAVQTLSTAQLIAPCYLIIGGLKGNEGAILTHNRTCAIDVWRLNSTSKRWYILETNYDHWQPPPSDDDRRDPANKMMTSLGQDKLNMDSLFKVLSTEPVYNEGTDYTTIMSASDPDSYTTWARYH